MCHEVAVYSKYVFFLLGHLNNSHCLAKSINGLAGALFSLYGPGDTDQRLQEFLAVRVSLLMSVTS